MVNKLHIIMPVKDSMDTAEQAIRALLTAGYTLTVWDDRSTPQTADRLDQLSRETGIEIVHISELTDHPSPNYRMVLIASQQRAKKEGKHLVIVESDVLVRPDTLEAMAQAAQEGVGMVAAVTVNDEGLINFPYEHLQRVAKRQHGTIETDKRLSFCCTLLTQQLLRTLDFEQLDAEKNWFDVTISHLSLKAGMKNLVLLDHPVVHRPHSSRPWKQLKYTNPLLYYWRKWTRHQDKI